MNALLYNFATTVAGIVASSYAFSVGAKAIKTLTHANQTRFNKVLADTIASIPKEKTPLTTRVKAALRALQGAMKKNDVTKVEFAANTFGRITDVFMNLFYTAIDVPGTKIGEFAIQAQKVAVRDYDLLLGKAWQGFEQSLSVLADVSHLAFGAVTQGAIVALRIVRDLTVSSKSIISKSLIAPSSKLQPKKPRSGRF